MITVNNYLLLLVTGFMVVDVFATENTDNGDIPSYQAGVLTIPRVDTSAQAGAFTNVEFVYDQELEAWHLTNAVEPVRASIDQVILLAVTDSFPATVYLQVSGEFIGCGKVGEIDQRFQDGRFEIQVYGVYPGEDMDCGLPVSPYLKVIPLFTYGLDAGDYEYSVNGRYNGTFNMPFNNRFGECEGAECLLTTSGKNID